MRSVLWEGSAVRRLLLASSVTVLLLNPLPTPLDASLIGRAAAESRDDLYKKCRQAVFRRYGQPGVQSNGRPGSRSLSQKFVFSATDQCVANGGRTD
jgi:hypothetical protein